MLSLMTLDKESQFSPWLLYFYYKIADCEKDDDCTEERPICGDFGVCIGKIKSEVWSG